MYSSTLAVTACIFSTNFAQIEAGVEDVADMLNSVVVVCLLSTNLVQVDAGVGDVLRESMMVNLIKFYFKIFNEFIVRQ